jgi:hypothetical protein
MVAARVDNWSAEDDLALSSHTVVWSPAERQRFAARGWISAATACSISTTVSTTLNQDQALDRSTYSGRGPGALRSGSESSAANVGSAGAEGEREEMEDAQGASRVIGGRSLDKVGLSRQGSSRSCSSLPFSSIVTTSSLRLHSKSMTWSIGHGCLRAGPSQRPVTCRRTRNFFT